MLGGSDFYKYPLMKVQKSIKPFLTLPVYWSSRGSPTYSTSEPLLRMILRRRLELSKDGWTHTLSPGIGTFNGKH